MADITLSSAVRANLLSLQTTADLLSSTQTKLATGLKVNSALDDPSAFFTASSLQSRANDLSRILDSVGGAVQTIKAADEGISSITKLVESAQATARQALQSAKPTNATVTGSGASISVDSAVTVTGAGLSDANNLLASLGATDVDAATQTGTAIGNIADLSSRHHRLCWKGRRATVTANSPAQAGGTNRDRSVHRCC
jgi:flagellin